MSETMVSLVLLPAVIWPLLVAGAVAFVTTRPAALRLVPWAALPALTTAAALPDTGLPLPGALLDSALVLDDTGRVFLLLSAVLWLAAGLLARPQLHTAGANRFAVLMLLAMAGGFALALAADALSFFAAGTLAAYALYGLLVHEADASAHSAGRVLVVLLVASDLLVFELLLILGQTAGSLDFTSLRQALVETDERGLVLGLLIVGFGIKTGLVGVHFWLAPVFVAALPAVRPALIGSLLGAGLLGWLRLLPLGEIHWPGAGSVMQWLAWVTLGYAVVVGLLQAHVRSVLAYAASALTSLWMAVLGAALLHPQAWNGMAEAVHAAVLQSGFAMAALLLLDRRMVGSNPAGLRHLRFGMMWIAALLLLTAPVGVAGFLAKVDGLAAMQVSWATAAIAFLAIRGLLPVAPIFHGSRGMTTSLYATRKSTQAPTLSTLPAAGGLTAAALLAAFYNLVGLSSTELWLIAPAVSVAALAAWLSAARLVPHLPVLPPGDLLVPIGNGLATLLGHAHRLADTQLPLWQDSGRALLRRLYSGVNWWRIIGRFESDLNRWPTPLVVLLLLGLVVAGLSASE